MSEHYYTNKPTTESNERTWSFPLNGETFRFTSDRGVFSKQEVDFGSRLLIEAFHSPDVEGDLLDVGCGYGPIGLALAKREVDRTVHMIDVNERAVALSKKNAEQNGISNVNIYLSSLFEKVSHQNFAAVVTNPPIRAGKKVVHQIFEESYEYLVNGGMLWTVIQKKQGAPSAIGKLHTLYQQVDVVTKKKGYYIICAKKID
ncbi:class I SAM-dependent methyltransferase [Halalkalibacterium ligniniphilum]|uniref:class I SAM-dependent methyltransferase n=1 Tax=Halalkalibacterium ligniniphilum TaxID=1134413 RepID=UPI00034C4B6E|nr:class I SAM-dependent methyltransferase [Halalkalibacterium ligniniphilum]